MSIALIFTIDTEGDDVWARPATATTHNAAFLERFQSLCDEFGVRPTWLVNHEMAKSDDFRRFGRGVIDAGTAEIGMHLHAWDSPPIVPLTPNDSRHHPYLIEFPKAVMREKIHALTGILEDTFGIRMTSHRAGRWAFDERYAELLLEAGYRVDCSVTPHVSWRSHGGHPDRHGGSDYRAFPEHAYWLDPTDISRPGMSELLEVPMTVRENWPSWLGRATARLENVDKQTARLATIGFSAVERIRPRVNWLRPTAGNHRHLRSLLERARSEQVGHAEFMLHSSELMPGGSPTFRDSAAIENLYRSLRRLFGALGNEFRPMTLGEFYAEALAGRPDTAGPS